MASEVFFTDMVCKTDDSLMNKLDRLIRAAGISDIEMEKQMVAIKTHFGEYGNVMGMRPQYAKVVADAVREKGGIPFLTDSNTLYVGRRKNAVEHIDTAYANGFSPLSTGCQVIIADGLKGTDDVDVPINGEYVKNAKIARAIADSDVIITLSHFKCHELAGFGGAIKNLAMGCASRAGKMDMHSAGKPVVDRDECRGCRKCLSTCAQDAISIQDGKAEISQNACAGCGRCIGACPFDAISTGFDQSLDILNAKMAEYALAAIKGKPSFHICIVADVQPFCDCHSDNGTPIVPNVGIFASFDPVALDRACVDAVQRQPMIQGSLLHINSNGRKPDDYFTCAQPGSSWSNIFPHAERIGLGTQDYTVTEVHRWKISWKWPCSCASRPPGR